MKVNIEVILPIEMPQKCRFNFELKDKPEPKILDPKDAIVKVTLASICTSDLNIKNGSV